MLDKVTITSEEHDEDSYDMDDNGDTVDELKPGEDVIIEIEAVNEYDENNDDVDIKSIDVYVVIDENGDLDVDEKEDMDRLKAEEEDSVTIEFDIEDDIDPDDFEGLIYVIGNDEFGARHGQKLELDFEVVRKTYDFVIKKAELNYDAVSCSRNNMFDLKIESIGTRGDDEIFISVENEYLGIDFEIRNIELDDYDGSDTTWSKSISFTVPDDLAAGTYPIRVRVFYSGDEDDGPLADLKDVDLVVKDCQATQPEPEEEPEEDETADVGDELYEPIPAYILDQFGITESVETSFKNSAAYTVLLIVGVIAALGLIGLMIVLLVKR